MNNLELLDIANKLFDRLITVDLTMRTLEYDKQRLNKLKMNKPLILWYDEQIKSLHNELKQLKKGLLKIGAKGNLQAEKEKDIQIYTLILRGNSYQYRYLNITLKNHVENELLKRLGLPPFTTSPYE